MNGLSVQQVIEEAIAKFSGETSVVHVAGRTDSGVHASGQVCHFDLAKNFQENVVRDAINYFSKDYPVSILKVEYVESTFHARLSAKERSYLYKITNRRAPLAIFEGLSWHLANYLNVDDMGVAAKRLLGHHDFSTFRAAGCQAKSPLKTLSELSVQRQGEQILIRARAPSFLYRQVRNMVGVLKLVGEKKWTPDQVTDVLKAADRTKGGPTAPAHGLYLTDVVY